MPATESFVSTAAAVSGTTAILMSVESFTSTCAAVSTATATFTEGGDGSTVLTRQSFFRVRKTAGGVFLTKAPTFGGTQATITYPITRDAALELAEAVLRTVN